MVGISVVVVPPQVQEYLLDAFPSRLDALGLTNVVTLIRSDVDDPDSFEFYPALQSMVRCGQVDQLQIDPTATRSPSTPRA